MRRGIAVPLSYFGLGRTKKRSQPQCHRFAKSAVGLGAIIHASLRTLEKLFKDVCRCQTQTPLSQRIREHDQIVLDARLCRWSLHAISLRTCDELPVHKCWIRKPRFLGGRRRNTWVALRYRRIIFTCVRLSTRTTALQSRLLGRAWLSVSILPRRGSQISSGLLSGHSPFRWQHCRNTRHGTQVDRRHREKHTLRNSSDALLGRTPPRVVLAGALVV